MATRKFADDDASLNIGSIVTSRSRDYSDLDRNFLYKPTTGDLYLVRDANAVKQAIRNLISTDYGERPFRPYVGSGVRGMLFELADDLTAVVLRDAIYRTIENFEPRAKVLDIKIDLNPDENNLRVRVEFQVVTSQEVTFVDVSLQRIR